MKSVNVLCISQLAYDEAYFNIIKNRAIFGEEESINGFYGMLAGAFIFWRFYPCVYTTQAGS